LKLGRTRQLQARELAGRVGEIVDGIADIRGHDTSNYERADLTRRLGKIFQIRFELYQRKFFVKFLNNFLAQVTPFIFYSFGGYLAIIGELSIGELVAVIAAYKDLPAPIKDLIDWDLQRQDAQIKYEQVIEQFHPPDVLPPELQAFPPEAPARLEGSVMATDITVTDDYGTRLLDGVSFDFQLTQHVAFAGPPGSGKEAAALLLARALSPRTGRVSIGGHDLMRAGEAITGRRVGYVGPDVFIFPCSLRDNILYGLKHQPTGDLQGKGLTAFERAEIIRSGNALFDPEADWIDYAGAGATGPNDIDERIFDLLPVIDFETDIYQFGLRTRIDPAVNPELADKALAARRELRGRLTDDAEFAGLVESFDPGAYNRNATLAENLLFGTPVSERYEAKELATNTDVRSVIVQTGLLRVLLEAGLEMADTMVELFRDLPPDHPFFEQFSFLASSELPDTEALLKRAKAASPLTTLAENDKAKLIALSFKYVDARHRLGLITDDVQARILAARSFLRARIQETAPDAVDFFDPARYSAAATFQDNVLLGRVAYGTAGATERIAALIADVLADLGLKDAVLRAGLAYDAGASGRRLSFAQRQKVGLLRALLKQPDLLIVNQGLAMLDASSQNEILASLLAARRGRGVVWTLARTDGTQLFDRVFVFEHGKIKDERVTSPKVAERAAE
jgi:putative ABC transport system ATP-binding protein